MECTEPGCDKPHMGRGLCKLHWQRQYRAFGVLPGGHKGRTIEERFWEKVAPPDENGCRLWTAGTFNSKNPQELYGMFWDGHRHVGAHRQAWIFVHGPIPEGKWVLHKCDRPPCVNVEHLFLGTQLGNTRDMDQKGRRGSLRGEQAPAAKLRKSQVERIREVYANGGITQKQLAAQYNVSHALISFIVTRRIWKD